MTYDTLRIYLERFDARSFLDDRVVVELTKTSFQRWDLVVEPLAGTYCLHHESNRDDYTRVLLSDQFDPRKTDDAGDAQFGEAWQCIIDAAGHDWALSAELVRIRMEFPRD